ncbi:beta-galactosidase [Lachnospiraceae bacterium ZAX-1]
MSKKKELQALFPIGTKYGFYRDRTDRLWETDFANMKACGMNSVRIHATWGTVEPNEGQFDFDYYDRIAATAKRYGLKVVFTIYLVCTPEWAFEKHPDSRYVSAAGTVWTPHQQADASTGGWPGLCLDSEPHRDTVENFLKAFTEHFKGNTDIIAFDIFHEPTEEPSQQYYQNEWRELVYCHCGHSKEKFRLWLKEKYGSLEELNHVWTRQYQNWEQVNPPKSVGMYTDWVDWKYFRADAQASAMHFLSDTIKKYDADRATVVHTAIYETGHPVVTSNDHFKLAGTTDMLGSSMYDFINPEITAFVCDLLRSVCDNGPYWVGETGTGAGPMYVFVGERAEDSFCFSIPITGTQIKKQSWGQIARGAKGILFWGWRPELTTVETISLGFTERNGELTERCDALKEFNTVLRRNQERLAQAVAPKSEVAILYNLDTIFTEGLISLGLSASPLIRRQSRYYKDSLAIMGAYKLCMANQIQPDFISKERVLNGDLAKYSVLLLPYSVSVTSDLAGRIEKFVKSGGRVISDGLCGYFTDKSWGAEVCPAGGLDQVFGLHVNSDYETINEENILYGDEEYHNVAKVIAEKMVVDENANVHATFASGRPAIVSNQYGEGKTAYIGTLFFANAMWNYSADTNRLFKQILELIHYKSPICLEGDSDEANIEVRVLEDKEGAFVFLLNHENKEIEYKLTLPFSKNQTITELISEEEISSKSSGQGVVLYGILKAEEVKIFRR